jgi:hypothetical protein
VQKVAKSAWLDWWNEHLVPWALSFGRSLALMLLAVLAILSVAIGRGTVAHLSALVFGSAPSSAQQDILRRQIVPPAVFTCYAFVLVLLIGAVDMGRFLRQPGRLDHLRNRLRFNAFLLLKTALALAGLLTLWSILRDPAVQVLAEPPSGETLTAWFWIFGLAAVGLVHWSLLDQRYRCRVCLRRLRMPVPTGSWSTPLLNRPATEYICPFGHGKVNVASVRLFGLETAHWTYYRDFWQELVEQEQAAHEE